MHPLPFDLHPASLFSLTNNFPVLIADEDDEEKVVEVRFVPDVADHLDAMFKAMNECQLLHPDPDDSVSEGEDGGDEYDVDHAERLLGVASSGAQHGNGTSHHEDEEEMQVQGQFDDAE